MMNKMLFYNTLGAPRARHIGIITRVIGKGTGKYGARTGNDGCSNYGVSGKHTSCDASLTSMLGTRVKD